MEEKGIKTLKGGDMMFFDLVILAAAIAMYIIGGIYVNTVTIIGGVVFTIIFILISMGFFILQPNQASALILFGSYKGTIKNAGWYWANPFFTKKKISLKTRNLNGHKLKVNDQMGNPIEIAAVVIWKVENTSKALFDVENYVDFVNTQSESALRHMAGLYPYDDTDDPKQISLRGGTDEVSKTLKNELQQRLEKAGVLVEEARLSHLAYAPEIAAAMLQRQQATAIIAARQKIVEGAVGMVKMAVENLAEDKDLQLGEERKAMMVSNLLVVLCGERAAQPVINTTNEK